MGTKAKGWKPKDQKERDRAVLELSRSLCVDAGAGTGKTTLLVNRILELVRNGSRLEKTAAITFTEKAAGELKVRLRDRIEDEYAQAEGSGRDIWLRARRELDRAQISTIHAFAAGLLRMRPVEAGVDPEFEMLDELGSQLFLDEVWEEWIARELEKEAGTLRRALTMRISLKRIRQLAGKIYDNRDMIPKKSPAPLFPDPEKLFSRVREEIESLSALAQDHCKEKSDNGYIHLKETRALVELAGGLEKERLQVFLFRDLDLKQKGNRKNWDPASACTEQKKRVSALGEELEAYRLEFGNALALDLLQWLMDFIGLAEGKKKDRGALDFQDLLILARNLIRDDPEVRKYFQDRFDHILVDEFQDTDPLQAELVFFLGEDGASAREWRQAEPRPGKLFIVGDPKQSIYGFRRADLEVYHEVKKMLGDDPVRISQNFRSSRSIIKWVNDAFSKIIQPRPGLQPEYEPLFDHPEFKDGLGHSSVMFLPMKKTEDETKKLKADDMREREADAIAGMIEKAVSEEWPVRDGEGKLRTLRYGDMAIVFPRRTQIRYYKDALELRGIPFQVEGGKQFFERDEVRALRACLKAIADPEDKLALVAALRSFFFGVSDEELFLYHDKGREWNYLNEKKHGLESIAQAFQLLRELHDKRNSRSFALTIEELLRRTYHRHLHLLRPHGQQAVLNLEKVMAKARAFEAQGITSFRRFAEWLEKMELEDREEAEMPQAEAEDDIVSLLTIHKAKGLEFPLVVLANLASGRGGGQGIRTITNRMQDRMEFRVDKSVSSPGFTPEEEERQKAKTESEDRRMLYVACTRARDFLVIPYFAKKPGDGAYAILAETLPDPEEADPGKETQGMFVVDTDDLPVAPAEIPRYEWQRARKRDDAAVDKMKAEKEQWKKAHKQSKEDAGAGIIVTRPTRQSEEEKPESRDGEFLITRDRGLETGIAVHRVLETIDPDRPEEAGHIIRAVTGEMNLEEEPDEILRLVGNALESDVLKRAVASGRFFREVPYTWWKSDQEVASGKIDLVFEEDDGLVIVDYKTGILEDPKDLLEKYRTQGEEYRKALEAITRKPVKKVIFAFLQEGKEVPI